MRTTLESAGTTLGWPVDFVSDLHKKLQGYAKEDYTEAGLFTMQTRLQTLVKQYRDWKLLDDPQVERVVRVNDETLADESVFAFNPDQPSWFRVTDVNRREFFIKVTP